MHVLKRGIIHCLNLVTVRAVTFPEIEFLTVIVNSNLLGFRINTFKNMIYIAIIIEVLKFLINKAEKY